jgi:hypothetical protein
LPRSLTVRRKCLELSKETRRTKSLRLLLHSRSAQTSTALLVITCARPCLCCAFRLLHASQSPKGRNSWLFPVPCPSPLVPRHVQNVVDCSRLRPMYRLCGVRSLDPAHLGQVAILASDRCHKLSCSRGPVILCSVSGVQCPVFCIFLRRTVSVHACHSLFTSTVYCLAIPSQQI